jgi:hypothetical protein
VRRQLPVEILSALATGNAYRVLPVSHGRHFNVWRFRRWDQPVEPGWKLVDQVRTREAAEDVILQRLGMEPVSEVPAKPVCVPAVIRPVPEDDEYHGPCA